MHAQAKRRRFLRLTGGLALALLIPSTQAKAQADDRNQPPLVVAQISEERIPAKDLASPIAGGNGASMEPSAIASPSGDAKATANDSEQSAPGDEDTDTDEPDVPEPMAPNDTPSPDAVAAPPDQSADAAAEPTPSAGPTPPPPALDLSTTASAPDLGAESLDPEIRRASSPALMASIRLTEEARRELGQSATDGALRDLGRAVSVDPGNPFAYYYLGRAYLARKNYAQALTFFQRAELGFAGRSDWLGETLSFEGACDEELGREPEAAKAYQAAVAAAPGNFRAQAGYGRFGPSVVQPVAAEMPLPAGGDLSGPPGPPSVATPAPPPDEPPPPASDSPD